MKTTQFHAVGITRLGAYIVTMLGLGMASASALTSVTVPLGGKEFGNGISIHATSGMKRLDPATAYTYTVTGKCRGTGTNTVMSILVPEPISFKSLLNSFKPGSGSFLTGVYSNPSGKFPITAINKNYSRTIPTDYGAASFTAKIVGGVKGGTKSGQVYFNITNVSIVPPIPGINIGTLKFEPGAKLVISVKR